LRPLTSDANDVSTESWELQTTEQTGYDKLDVSQRRDRQGRVTWFFHDALRRQVATRDPAGRTVTHGWLLGGSGCSGCAGRDTLVDAKGQATTWERDLQGRVLREVRADGVTATVYSYEAQSGRLHTVTDPSSK
jgi:YD repeat-containing protein